jgi:hypothetical protein
MRYMAWVAFLLYLAAAGIGRAQGYGWHRDELYYAACGERLAMGYVDQSSLVPLLARLVAGNLWAMSVLCALAYAGLVALIQASATRRGASRDGARLAAVLAAASPGAIVGASLFGTVIFDQFACALLFFLFTTRWAEGPDPDSRTRGSLALLGAAFLVGWAKPLGLVFAFALAAHLAWRKDRAGALAVAGGAFAGVAPWILWQSAHAWPALEFARGQAEGRAPLLIYSVLALVLAGPLLWALAVRARAHSFAWGMAAFGLVVFAFVGGKPYYPFPFFFPLMVELARAVERPRGWSVAAGLLGLATAGYFWPLAPVAWLDRPAFALVDVSRERVGWPEWKDQISGLAAREGVRQVLVANYGQAGILRGTELVPICGHNQYAIWPMPEPDRQMLSVGYSEGWLKRHFQSVEMLGTIQGPAKNEERGLPIARVEGPVPNLRDSIRHFD